MHVLMLEDSVTDALILKKMLSSPPETFRVRHLTTLTEALASLDAESFDLILLDLFLPDSGGIETFHRTHAAAPYTPIIVLTSANDEALAIEAVRHGAQDYLLKSDVAPAVLQRAMKYAVERQRLVDDLHQHVKETTVLHRVAQLLVEPEQETLDVLQRVVKLIPPAFQYPDSAGARITVGEYCVFSHAADVFPERSLQERFLTADHREGLLEVFYDHLQPLAFQGPFLEEEIQIVRTLAEMVTSFFDRRHALREIRNQRAIFQGVLQNLPVGVWITDADGRFVDVNDAGVAIWAGKIDVGIDGYGQFKAWWTGSGERIAGEDWAAARAIRKGETSLNELINIEAFDGTRKTILNSAIPIYDDHGDLQRVVVVNQEVTDLKRAQDAARDAAEQRLAILNALPANIALLNGEGEIIAVNEGWRQFLRSNQFFDDRSGKGQNFLEIFQRATHMGETEAPFVAMGIRAVLRREVPDFVIEYSFPAPDGTCWFRLSAGPLDTSPGAVVMYLDISARKTAEEDLRRQKELLQTIFDTIPVMIATFNKDGRLEWLNRECERVFGWPMEVIGQIDILQEIYPDAEYRKLVYDFVRTASKEWKDFKSLTRDGRLLTTSWAIVRLSNGSTLCIGQDLTHRRLLEEQLMQAQKMEGIGRLAGGVAHDFNNLLSAILGYSEFAVASLDEADPLRADIEQIRKAGERAADLTRQLLAFARRQIVEPRTLDLNELISATSRLLRRLIGEDIELVILQEADLLRVRVDPGHFEQVLVNLAVNARDAMPEGGKLCIETKNVQLDHTYEEQYGRSRSGPHVLVEVADTGVGMPEDVAAHAFEPFYTTKEVGKGTGLGLSTCYGIVKQAEGDIWIASKPGAGTAIRIYLPAVPSVVAAAESRALEEKVKGGDECILLVEDEPLVREMVRKALTRLGYQVLVADCGTEALRVAADVLDKIDLLLTDIVMPHMGGKEVADKLLEQRPGLKVLFMSGYTEDAVIRKRVQDEGIAFLSKPFTARALGRKVREVLDKPVTS